MGARVLHTSLFLLLSLSRVLLSSGSSNAEKLPPKSIWQSKKLDLRETPASFSPLIWDTQQDTIPIVNPTSPTTVTPFVTFASPPPPITTQPTTATPTSSGGAASLPPPTITQPTTTAPTSSGRAWCVAAQTAPQTALQVALDYACGKGGADCSAIQAGGSCYNPNTVRDHASYAFNDYYQKNPGPTSCVFGGTAQLIYTDPSSGNCHYASPKASTLSPTPPSPRYPICNYSTASAANPYTSTIPTGGSVSGPTASPSSADSVSCSLVLLVTMTCLSILEANIS
ncbi:hypothetical protein NMG60_11015082 [Bertholletia excelsa]